MLRFAARLDALGQRSVWYLPGGPGRDWATSRYREAADMALSLMTSSSKWQRRATKQRRRRRRQLRVAEGVAVSMVSCQLVRASAANLLERHCENGAPERSRWDHAAGTDLEAPLAHEVAGRGAHEGAVLVVRQVHAHVVLRGRPVQPALARAEHVPPGRHDVRRVHLRAELAARSRIERVKKPARRG